MAREEDQDLKLERWANLTSEGLRLRGLQNVNLGGLRGNSLVRR